MARDDAPEHGAALHHAVGETADLAFWELISFVRSQGFSVAERYVGEYWRNQRLGLVI